VILSVEAASASLMRQIWVGLSKEGITQVKGILPLDVASYLLNKKRKELARLETRYGVSISLHGQPDLPPGNVTLEFLENSGNKEK
jgi:ribonuclease E